MKNLKEKIEEYRIEKNIYKTEVKTMAHVMTPISLVEDMLDTLPCEVWINPNLKWLDPCNGIGTFFCVIIERLMKGLESFEPNEKLRYKHILENMIYACELQEKNITIYKNIFNIKDEYALNVYCGSYLDEGFDNHMKEIWGLDKFDVIVMNPPYQTLKEGNSKSQPLWDKFVFKTISQLIEGGYLVAVHPDGWRSPYGIFKYVQKLLRSKQILYLELHNTNDGIKTFGVNTTYDFYCLRNISNTIFTKIKCTNGTTERVDISKMEFIPNVNIKFVQSLIAKDGEERVEILYSRSAYGTDKINMSKYQNEEFKYPCVYTVKTNDEPTFFHSSTQEKGHFGIPKVIWGNGASYGVLIDSKGDYGLTQFAYAIVDEPKNLNHIKKALQSKEFIKDVMGYNGGSVLIIFNRKVISLFRKDFWKEFI